MKNKYQRINEFLNLLKEVLIQNPNLNINKDTHNSLYKLLVTYDLIGKHSKSTLDLQGVFDNWKRRFTNSKQKINTVVNNSYIEFTNIQKTAPNPKNYICIQVPIDHEHIENSINILIDFLQRMKINHITTISTTEKSDNVILKLENINDVDLVCDYINSNKYIKEGLIEPNPFIFNYKGFSITTGNQVSYNQTLTEYIRIYFNDRIQENKLNLVGSKDFIDFLTDYYYKVFVNRSELDNHCKYFNIPDTKNSTNMIVNYMNITEQIIKNCDPEFNIQSFIEHYEEYKNSLSFNKKIVKFQHYKLTKENIHQTNQILEILFQYLTIEHSEEDAIHILEAVILDNRVELITREDDLRKKLLECNFCNNMLSIFQNEQKNLAEYLRSLNITKKSDSKIKEEVDQMILKLISFYCENPSLVENDDLYNTIKKIQFYIETKDQSFITRAVELRKLMMRTFFVEKANYIIKKMNVDCEEYITNLVQQHKVGLFEYFENAIGETYEKYMKQKENNSDDSKYIHSGRDAAIYALNEFFAFGHYSVFTRNNNARENLENNVSVMDAVNIMRKSLKYPTSDKHPSIDELNYLIPNYVDLVLDSYQIKKILR